MGVATVVNPKATRGARLLKGFFSPCAGCRAPGVCGLVCLRLSVRWGAGSAAAVSALRQVAPPCRALVLLVRVRRSCS